MSYNLCENCPISSKKDNMFRTACANCYIKDNPQQRDQLLQVLSDAS